MFKRSDVINIYFLTPMQEGMLYHYILDKKSSAYFEQNTMDINGTLDLNLVEKTFNKLIEKYDVLRTVFLYKGLKRPRQVLLKAREAKVEFKDISWLEDEKKTETLIDLEEKDREKGFDLEKDIPMRILMVKTNEERYKLIWSFHHIIMDGWCLAIIIKDFLDLYKKLKNGDNIKIKPMTPYSTYIKWLEKKDKSEAIDYWMEYLKGYEEKAVVPEIKNFRGNEYNSKEKRIKIDKDLTNKLKTIAKKYGLTINTVFEVIWGILLSRYNNTEDVVFGSVVAGRSADIPDIENMVGLFINTIPIRIKYEKGDSFIDLARKVQYSDNKSRKYDYVPLAEIQSSSELKQQLINHILVFENYPIGEELAREDNKNQLGFSIDDIKVFEHTNYDITIIVLPGDSLNVSFKYNALIYDDESINRIGMHLLNIVERVIENEEIEVYDIEILTEKEKEEILYSFNDTAIEYHNNKTIVELFEEQVNRTPDNISVTYKDKQLTYRELNERANKIANRLREKGVDNKKVVGIMVERSIEMIVGIMGILKSGAGCLPISTKYPKSRIEYMLKDSNAEYILITDDYRLELEKIDGLNEEKLIEIVEEIKREGNIINPETINKANDLMYLIYTSGTTGKPKGVMVGQRVINNLCSYCINKTGISFKNRVLHFSSIGFDVAFQEIFYTMLSGGELCIADEESKTNISKLIELITNRNIETIHLPAALVKHIFSDEMYVKEFPACVKDIMASGEKLIIPGLLKGHMRNNGVRIHNHYGPSETHVVTTYTQDYRGEIATLPPIGKPIGNTRAYILDKEDKIAPVGVVGQLCISGDSLGMGYLNKEELTNQKFTDNPFEKGNKMYRTGDLAKWLPDGNIEFLGRIDHQVKIRGHRIELGEIENIISKQIGVKEVVVLSRKDKSEMDYLCAYIIKEENITLASIKEGIRKELPQYMIPSVFIEIDKIPLTTNKKIDRKALFEIEVPTIRDREYEGAKTEVEAKLIKLWEDVLGVEGIGIYDNFFDLGGHSLKAMVLSERVKKELNIEVNVSDIFECSNIRLLSLRMKESSDKEYEKLIPLKKQESYSASSAQKRIYAIQMMDKESTVYNMPLTLELTGKVDKKRIEKAIENVVTKHEALRTSFHLEGEEIVQQIRDEVKIDLKYAKAEEKEEINKIIKDWIKPFNLEKAPLLRAGIIETNDSHILMLDMHHIISDGTTMGILADDFVRAYEGIELDEEAVQYKEYAAWEKEQKEKGVWDKQREYWKKEYEGEIPVLELPIDGARGSKEDNRGDTISFEIEESIITGIKKRMSDIGGTLYMGLMAAISILMSKYSSQEDIVIGMPIAGRRNPQMEKVAGMFVNTLAIRSQPENEKNIEKYLQETKQKLLQAYENQEYPYEELVEEIEVKRDLNRNPLFDVMLVLQNTEAKEMKLSEIEIKPWGIENETAKFDITLTASEAEDKLVCQMNYKNKLFKRETIEGMIRHYIKVLKEIAENKEELIKDIELLEETEKKQLISKVNDIKVEYDENKTIVELLEEQLAKASDKIAVTYGKEKLTYNQLNIRTNQLARVLRDKGVKRDTVVGIIVEPSLEMIVSILAILKSGGAYLPIDPYQPEERIEYILKDSNTQIVVASKELIHKIKIPAQIIDIDNKPLSGVDGSSLEKINKPNDLAYIIYTSGSTGKPKGVMIEHRNVTSLMANNEHLFNFNNNDIWCMFHSYAFDFSVWEMFGALLNGGKLVVIPKYITKDTKKFLEVVEKEEITVLNQTPSAFYNLINEEMKGIKRELKLRYVIFGGEALNPSKLRIWKERYPNTELINMYGITETTVHVTFKKLEERDFESSLSNIGKEIPTLNTYIMDKSLKLLPIGVPGEICVSGGGVARGYLGKPKLTEEKFVANPYKSNEKLYRSGDLGRLLQSGEIEYLGRIDNQVKIRGYRIELGEIENTISKQKGIKGIVVLSRKDKIEMDYLCAYIEKEAYITIESIKEGIRKELPEYMIPSVFIELNEIPLTLNGKIDRKSLLKIEATITKDKKYEGPSNETEARFIELWEDILGIEGIGVHDNFFDLGGHSLKATILSGRIQKELDVEITVRDIFNYPNIKELSKCIKESTHRKYEKLKPLKKNESYPVSSAQRRIYAIQMIDKENTIYNMPLALELTGKVDRERIEKAIEKLVVKHEALRTSFHLDGEEIVQKISDQVKIEFKYAKVEDKTEVDNILTNWIKPFNLEKAPLLRAGIIETRDSHILMLDMHHIISDGTTMGILADDFVKAYEGIKLDTEPVQYKEYAMWEKEQKEKGVWDKQREYWKKEYEGEIPVLELPIDGARGSKEDNRGDTISFEIEESIITGIKKRMSDIGGTLYMGLMAAISILMSKYSSQEDIVIGMPIAGRRNPQMEKVAGMFVNTLAIRTYPEGEKVIEQYLEETKQKLLRAYENQEYPYEELVELAGVKRDLSRNPLFDVMLVLQNTELKEMKLSEINIKPYEINDNIAKFDLAIAATEVGNKLECRINYKTRLFKREIIEAMIEHYIKVLREIGKETDLLIKDIELLEEKEKERLLKQFNNIRSEYHYNREKTIVDLFEEQVEKNPKKIAVIYGHQKLTYEELNKKANLISWRLKKAGLKSESIAVIISEADISYIVGIMGILKAGGAYLPILPDYPKERIQFMLKDSNAACLLKQSNYKIEDCQGVILDIDKVMDNDTGEKTQSMNNSKSENAAYVIYTSGSTGNPKGVVIEHRNIANQIIGLIQDYGYGDMKNQMLYSEPVFDVSVQHIFTALCSGSALHLMTNTLKTDYHSLYQYVKKNKIGFINMVPAQMEAMVEFLEKDCEDIRFVLGAEAFPPHLHEKIIEGAKPKEIYNMYGPTETTINALIYKCKDHEQGRTIPIGKPMRNYGVCILNKHNKLQPMGIPGELCISGTGLARGYINNEKLTKEKFVENPFINGERMYRTGDLARWLPDGNIEFLGRIDNQVKIRGYRIELGEIENIFRKQAGVREITVLSKEDEYGDKYLCGYIVKEEATTIEAICEGAKKKLPKYMVPGVILEIDKLPLTNNGKINKKALLNMEVTGLRAKQYRGARNEIEEKLVRIWEEILNTDKIGVYDDFFELGGHSLKATTLSSRIQKELDVEITVKDIFECSNIRELTHRIRESSTKKYENLKPLKKQESYPVSSAQRRIYAIQMMDKESTMYNMPLTLELTGKVDRGKIERAIEKLILKHEALRTSFHLDDEEIVQKIDDKVKIELDYAKVEEKEEIDKIIAGWIKPFNLEKSPLLRTGIIEHKDRYILMLDMHHIISDGTTMGILAEDFVKAYEGTALGINPVQYKEYAMWENQQKENGVWDKQREYWKKEYEGEIPVLELPMDGARGSREDNSGDTISFEIEESITKDLKEKMSDIGGTLYMGLMSAISILMSKYSGQQDIVIGTVVAGRRHPQMEKVAGMFVNTLAIRTYPEGEKTIEEYLRETKQKLLGVYENQEYPYEELVEEVGVKRDLSRNPLFDVMIALQNTELKEMKLSEIEIRPWEIESKTAKFDITLTATEAEDRLLFQINYKNKLFKREAVEGMIRHYIKVVEEICINKEGLIKDIELIHEEEKRHLVFELNETNINYSRDKTIHELFEKQVESTPNNISVVYKDEELRYREVNERANQLARVLREKGVKPDTIVGIMVEPTIEMVVGILAILKSGGAYLPIDPNYPKDRIEYMLRDSESSTLLTQSRFIDMIEIKGPILDIENKELYEGNSNNLGIINKSTDLAYVIYTSGSTGKSKGVMVEHKSLVNLCTWHKQYYSVTSSDKASKYAGFSFDASVWEMFPYLTIGASLYIVDNDIKLDVSKLNNFFEDNNITIGFLPTQMYERFKEVKNKSLRILLTGGDKLKDYKKCNYQVYNNYGPTENTVVSTSYSIKEYSDNIPIGKPISNTQIYIVDKENNLQPIGVPGELCISGEGLARGYLNRPELTAERFVESPFVKGKRMYKTGDLARWLPDGNIEFLGRIDHQVKIRGYRIELGEIENTLLKHESIRESVVIAREDQNENKYLCGYIVADEKIHVSELRNYLKKDLPEYMMPSYLLQLDEIPITPNGKIDRKALPEPEGNINSSVEYEAPTNEIEKALVNIWKEVLSTKKEIGINDSFFEIGGDSIKAMQIAARLQKYSLKLEIQKIFEYPTIKLLSHYVKDISNNGEQGIVEGHIKLTPIQKWFFKEKITDMHHWNQSVMLYRENGFKVEIVEAAFKELVKHHDTLRMVYAVNEKGVSQINRGVEVKLIDIEIHEIKEEHEEFIAKTSEKIQSSIELSTGPLVKLGLFRTKKGDYLLIAIHHLVIDGVSWRIIFEDFTSTYKQIQQGQEVELPLKTTSFKKWAEALSKYSKSKELLKEIGYWRSIENEDILSLPKDNEVKENRIKGSENVSFELSKEETQNLLEKVNRAYNTEINDILLSALGLTIKEWTGSNKILINLEGHGREEIIENVDITRTVGWFTAQYPLVLDMKEAKELSSVAKNTKETLRRIPNKGIGYGILKYITPQEYREGINFNLTPEISFNYLGQFDTDVDNDLFEVKNTVMGNAMSIEGERQYVLNIVGAIAGGLMNITIDYNKHEYTNGTISMLMEKFKSNLQRIIEHCASREKMERTPSDFTSSDLNNATLETVFGKYNPDIVSDIYSLSPMQEGMLFHHIMDNNASAYFEQTVIDVNGKLDLNLVENSFNKLIEKYDVLRTVFLYEGLEKPRQVLLKTRQEKVEFKDISGFEEANKARAIGEIEEMDREKGFDLEQDIPIRISIIKTHEDRYKLIWSFHHIIMDGWCLAIIIRAFLDFYIGLKNGEDIKITYTTPYSAYIKWLEKRDKSDGIKYWREYLKDYEEQAIIPTTRATRGSEYKLEKQRIELRRKFKEKLMTISKKHGVTINTIFEVVWGILLSRYNNIQDVVFGGVVAGRSVDIPDIESMVGLFINTIPVRIKYEKGDSFIELARKVQEKGNQSRKYDYIPLAEIQSNSKLKQKLINHILVFENYPIGEELAREDNNNQFGFSIDDINTFEHTNYDFSVVVAPGNNLNIILKYNSMIYDVESINRIGMNLLNVLEEVTENEAIKIEDIKIQSDEERKDLIYNFNDTSIEYPRDKTIKQLFEEQVEKTPDNIAVVYENKKLTYKELNERANSIAKILKEKGVKTNSIVGIMVQPSLEIIIGILAVLKSGGCYLPINPEYPIERVKYMLDDSGANIILSKTNIIEETVAEDVIYFDDEKIYRCNNINLESISNPSDLAYVIYTSGTTGKSKGVLVKNNSLINYTNWFKNKVSLSPNDKSILVSSFCFDLGYTSIYPALLVGAELHIVSKKTYLIPEQLLRYIKVNGITYIKLTPSLFTTIVNSKYFTKEVEKALRLIVLGGEAIRVNDLEKLKEITEDIQVINHYGPTEATIGSIAKKIDLRKLDIYKEKPTIGKPISNTQIYIIDKSSRLVVTGVPGEICISGEGLAKGYLNRTNLTKQKFTCNPFVKGQRMYKTGDLGRWLSNGEIEFLGRVDNQVKIRGYRIELREIENVLNEHHDIIESAVTAKEDSYGNKYLAAYVAPKIHKKPKINEIYDYIRKKLPDYMIPSRIMIMPKLPLTPNGKIDRFSLSESNNYINRDERLTAPRNEIELEMLEIWQRVLGIEKISIFDNFFTLGGHSITAMVLIEKIRNHFNIELPLTQIFEFPTIAQISSKVKENRNESNKCLITIQKGNDFNRPLFIIHPQGGGVFSYFDLAKALGVEKTVYGIQAVGLDSDEEPYTSVELMAARYIKEIKGVAPIGPYCIAGWSFGGLIAFEIARQLEVIGEEIEFIGIIDSRPPEIGKKKDVQEDLSLYIRCAILVGMDITKFNGLEEEKIFKLVIRRVKEMTHMPQGATKEKIEKVMKVLISNITARNNYEPNSEISLDIHLFHATERLSNNKQSLTNTMGWDKHTSGEITLIPVPGNHLTMMEPPNVTSLAEAMNAALNGNVCCEEASDIS